MDFLIWWVKKEVIVIFGTDIFGTQTVNLLSLFKSAGPNSKTITLAKTELLYPKECGGVGKDCSSNFRSKHSTNTVLCLLRKLLEQSLPGLPIGPKPTTSP